MSVIAILCADLHLSLKPPLARSVEKDWIGTQRGYLRQLDGLVKKYKAALLCSGDVFDKWNAEPEVVNLALECLPNCFAICGQHDLRHHAFQDLKKTSFYTLVQAGKVKLLEPQTRLMLGGCHSIGLQGFSWGFDPVFKKPKRPVEIEIALVHRYFWYKNTGYNEAPEEAYIDKWAKNFDGFHVVSVGDNHIPWHCKLGNTLVWNNGGFMRRKSDEREHHPSVGLLHSDEKKGLCIERHYLDCSQDKFLEQDDLKLVSNNPHLLEVMEELAGLEDVTINFQEAVWQALKTRKVNSGVKELVLKAMEERKK